MTLLVTADVMRLRRDVASGPLAPLAASLAHDLEPLLERDLFIPDEKAQLSRIGGRCEKDGSLLEFDPWSPRAHRCALCGSVYTGEAHYRFWIYWYQLWLIERAVHASLLSVLGAGETLAARAREILSGYAERYAGYPNVDNVLGPTRLFFSTYLESIWLLYVCLATDLLEVGGDARIGAVVRERIVEPSSEIVAEYDEGASNRQVWNVAALFAAHRLLGRDDAARRLIDAPSGLLFHLREGLLDDGTWYEGENYHQFAHRGLWYGVTMAEHGGIELPPKLVRRFEEGFATPFLTAMPDLTLPSRRDSQYRISLRQWRFAELCELGLARRDEPRLVGALARLYDDDVPRCPTGRDRSSAEAERNAPPSALAREDLGWRSLLFARAELPALNSLSPQSALLPGQGIAVLRREEGSVYAALDYGHSGGGHGHPDRLNLLLADGEARWLDDMGTGSYVDPSLHWYRSTLAHNAPLVNGRSQLRVHGRLGAFEERDGAGWCVAEVRDIAPGVVVRRTIVAMSEYLLDVLDWQAGEPVTLDLPLHLDARVITLGGRAPGELFGFEPAHLGGNLGLEDGFRFVGEASRATLGLGALLQARSGERSLRAWLDGGAEAELWRLSAPGAPPPATPTTHLPFWVVRTHGRAGQVRSVFAWSDTVQSTGFRQPDVTTVRLTDGVSHEHERTESGWQIRLVAQGAHRTIDLGGLVRHAPANHRLGYPTPVHAVATERVLERNAPRRFELGEAHYRRSEETWRDAGAPSAEVTLTWTGTVLRVQVQVAQSERTFVSSGAENPWDNENADVNGDGVQLYVDTAHGRGAWMLVPESGIDRVSIRGIDGWSHSRRVEASWMPLGEGYAIDAAVSMDDLAPDEASIGIDVMINEKPAGRVRRRGQLVLSGAHGEFVYLRGDRHDANRLLHFKLSHG